MLSSILTGLPPLASVVSRRVCDPTLVTTATRSLLGENLGVVLARDQSDGAAGRVLKEDGCFPALLYAIGDQAATVEDRSRGRRGRMGWRCRAGGRGCAGRRLRRVGRRGRQRGDEI